MRLLALLTLFAVLLSGQSRKGEAPDSELFRTLASLDAAVFDAYNKCEPEKFGAYFADDLEFYDDRGGLTRSRQSLVEAVKNYICGKVRQELVAGTLEVYPMEGYGALQVGVHRFLHPNDPKERTGEAKFIPLWQKKDGRGRLRE